MEKVLPQLAHALELLKKDSTCLAAEQEFAEASKASLEAFGENNIVTARTLANLARVCASRGKEDIAVAVYERILKIHEALPMPSNSDHAMALLELASLKERSTDDDAERLLCLRTKADQIMEEIAARAQESSLHAESLHSHKIDDGDGVFGSTVGSNDSSGSSNSSSSSSSTASSSSDESEKYGSDVDRDDENLEENCEADEDDGTTTT